MSNCFFFSRQNDWARNSFSKSLVSRRRAEDSAIARQGEDNNDTDELEQELLFTAKNLQTLGGLCPYRIL